MRITQLSLAGRGAWNDLHIPHLSPQLNVFYGKPGAGKSTVAQLVNHLLYGKFQSPWRQQFGQTVPLTEGRLVVDNYGESFSLRRHVETDAKARLTVAANGGATVDGRTVQKLLSDLSPQLLAQLLAVDFAEAPSVEGLLSKNFSHELAKTHGGQEPLLRKRTEAAVDRRRVDELIHQRDMIVQSIERQMAVRRQEGEVLARELDEIEDLMEATRRQLDAAQTEERSLVAEIAECETRLRYVSLESVVSRQVNAELVDTKKHELETIDAEITASRKTLVDLQSREATIRSELARLAPDGTVDRVNYLADTRTTVGVLERLIGDLDAEIALLARGYEPGRPIDDDAHARLTPVAAMLRQQTYSLCGLLTEQERSTRRQQLAAESRQISRSQLDFSERLEILLQRREQILRELELAGRATIIRPNPPAVDHCRCDYHAEFVKHADPLLIGYRAYDTQEQHLHDRHAALLRQLEDVRLQADKLTRQLSELDNRWKTLQSERAGLVGNASLEEQRFEVERLEIAIRDALQPANSEFETSNNSWRASDVLAQLTGGHLVQIRLDRGGKQITVIDRLGQAIELASLSTAAHDQLYLSLTLALVGSFSRRDIQLPLVLDEPFLRQDPVASTAMAGVLAEFARAGHQVLVFTEDRDALHRFESLSGTIFDLAQLRRRAPERPNTVERSTTTFTRVVYDSASENHSPVLKLRLNDANVEPQFLLTVESSIAEFPVLGSGTLDAFTKIGITTVGQLLTADAEKIAQQLQRKTITRETVQLWQSHMQLMCSVPGLTLNDAQILTACGIRNFAELARAIPIELEATIRDLLNSDRGQRFAGLAGQFNASQLREWIHLGTHSRKPAAPVPLNSNARPQKIKTPVVSSANTPKFYLSRQSSVVDAPSIGPRTAEHLARVGIRTVADLLQANPASTAAELAISHISASTIADWQLQARLTCQIPDLRGYGAQILVACGYTSADQVASTRVSELIRKVQAYCKSKPGQQILRGNAAPSPEKIKRWFQNAGQRRPLEAA